MDDDRGWRLGHRPQLDVLRAVAVLLVVAGHSGLASDVAGSVGVTMFFALSGFLITTLLLEERSRRGRISLSHFYVRRACRLLPALTLFLTSMALVAFFSGDKGMPTAREFAGALLYVGNYTTGMQGRDNVLLHTWSLAVEEQFYIVWPCVVICVLAVARGRVMFLVLLAATASLAALVLRVVLWEGGEGALRVYFGTDTRMDCILVGCLAALWMHGRPAGRNRPGLAVGSVAAAAAITFVGDTWAVVVVAPTLVALLTVVAILCTVQQPLGPMLGSAPLQVIGQRSYAIYLWHFPLFAAAGAVQGSGRWAAVLGATLVTAGIVHLSWCCVEEPFLRLKDSRLRSDKVAAIPAERLARLTPSA